MAFVVGILESGNHGLGGVDALGQLGLREAGVPPQFERTLGNFAVGKFILEGLLPLRVMAGDIRQNLRRAPVVKR